MNSLIIRIFAAGIGASTWAWQIYQIASGHTSNMFLVADIILGAFLIAAALMKPGKSTDAVLLSAFSYATGVYFVPTFGSIVTNNYDFGAFTTTIGMIPSAIISALLIHNLRQSNN